MKTHKNSNAEEEKRRNAILGGVAGAIMTLLVGVGIVKSKAGEVDCTKVANNRSGAGSCEMFVKDPAKRKTCEELAREIRSLAQDQCRIIQERKKHRK